MRRLLSGTTALALALSGPLPVAAQTRITVQGQEVICLPNKKADCPDGSFCVVAKNKKACRTKARDQLGVTGGEEPVAIEDEAQAAPAEEPVEDAVVVDEGADQAADQAAAEEAARLDAEMKAAEEAAAAAEAEAEQAAIEAAAQAEADQVAAEEAARLAADQAAAEEAAQAEAAAEKAARKAERQAKKAAEEAAEAEAEAEVIVVDETSAEDAPAEAAPAEETPAEETPVQAEAVEAEPTPEMIEAAEAPETAPVTEEQLITLMDPAEGVEAPTVEQVEMLTDILGADPAAGESPEAASLPEALTLAEPIVLDAGETPIVIGAEDDAPVVVEDAGDGSVNGGETPVKKKKKKKKPVVIDVTEEDVRKSDEDFVEKVIIGGETPVEKKSDKGLSDLEKFGLVVVGALVVGSILNNGNKVVSNTGDRVVVQQPDGQYVVLKDDDTLIRRPGSNVQTETFDDGSTRSVVSYSDGSRIVTIRDASGRVLRRSRYDAQGREVRLIDDTVPVERIDVSTLPKPGAGRVIGGQDAELAAAMASLEADDVGRRFSLRQIREYPQVRALAPELNVERVTFETGSAAIRGSEAQKLRELGLLMSDLIRKNPREVFLIEGHTDAVGNGAYNLALSDRRAESLALALTEYFDVPPENMVVQGYGESELLVQSAGDEPRNRRTAVRLITGLLTRAE